MAELLDRALAEIARLPEGEQETLAAWILDELASERRWQEALAGSEDALAQLADEALVEHHQGQTLPLDPDRM